MNLRKFSLITIFCLSISACATPTQKLLGETTTSQVPAKLNSILQSAGQVSDEDINVTVYKSVISSVVTITTTSSSRSYFNFNAVKGTGSGSVISKDGYILTNYHVISGARNIEVTLSDEKKYPAILIGGDKDKDVAIIKISPSGANFTVASFGNSDEINVGQKVLAIGSPYGLEGTLTTGTISSLNRTLPAEDGTVLRNIIQTDAAINPGNSGGPLFNAKGEIIGVNTAIFSPNGANVGIGFAVPINNIKEVLKNLETKI